MRMGAQPLPGRPMVMSYLRAGVLVIGQRHKQEQKIPEISFEKQDMKKT